METISLVKSSARSPNTPAVLPRKDIFLQSTLGSSLTFAFDPDRQAPPCRHSCRHRSQSQDLTGKMRLSSASVSIPLLSDHGVTWQTWNRKHTRWLILQSLVLGVHPKEKGKANCRPKASVKARVRVKASPKTRANPLLHHGKAAQRVRAKSPLRDLEAARPHCKVM